MTKLESRPLDGGGSALHVTSASIRNPIRDESGKSFCIIVRSSCDHRVTLSGNKTDRKTALIRRSALSMATMIEKKPLTCRLNVGNVILRSKSDEEV